MNTLLTFLIGIDQVDFPSSPKLLEGPYFGQKFSCAAGNVFKQLTHQELRPAILQNSNQITYFVKVQR